MQLIRILAIFLGLMWAPLTHAAPYGNQPLTANLSIQDCRDRWSGPGAVPVTHFTLSHYNGYYAVFSGSNSIYMECGAEGNGYFTVYVTVPRAGLVMTAGGYLSNRSPISDHSCYASGLARQCVVHSFNK